MKRPLNSQRIYKEQRREELAQHELNCTIRSVGGKGQTIRKW